MGEDGRAVAFHVLVEAQTKASFGQHTSKRGLAHFPIQLDQVESVEDGVTDAPTRRYASPESFLLNFPVRIR